MPVAQLVEHLTFNQGVRDSNSRGRTKKHQTNFCPVLFCCVIQDSQHCDSFFGCLARFSFPPDHHPHPEQVGEDPVGAGGHHGREQCPGQHHPMAICPSICRVPGIHSLSAGGCLLLISPIPTTNTVPPCRGSPACGTVLCYIRLLSGYCFFLASCLPTAHSQSNAAAARAGYTIRPNSWYQVGIK